MKNEVSEHTKYAKNNILCPVFKRFQMTDAHKIRICTLTFMILSFTRLCAQDSMILRQSNAAMFSNVYVFYSNGTFKHYYKTDDLQIWYGCGTYKDRFGTRILLFGDADSTYKTRCLLHYEVNFRRKLRKRGNTYSSRDFYHTSRKRRVVFSPSGI